MRHQAKHTMRLVRTTHEITITQYGTVHDLIEALNKCPSDARIVDRDIDDFGNYILTFQQETELDKGHSSVLPKLRYTHRNGETEVPDNMETAQYWFDGVATDDNGNKYAIVDVVECSSLHVYNDVAGQALPKSAYSGQWWGPITPPWEEAT